jgi:Tfp pilus assembly protein PilO
MKKEDLIVFSLGWIAANSAQLVQLLQALLPVVAVCALGYAIHVMARDKGKKK